MKIIPYSALDTEAQLAPTQANFPALRHLFKCDEATQASAWRMYDSIGNVVLGNASTGLTNNGDGTLSLTGAGSLISGTWSPIAAGNKVLTLILGKPTVATNSFTMGSVAAATNFGIRSVSSSTPTASANDVSTRVGTTTGAGNSAARAVCSFFNFGSATGIGSYTFAGGASVTAIAAIGDVSAAVFTAGFQPEAISTLSATMNPALIAVMHFATLPSDLEMQAMVAWMYNNTLVNSAHSKTIYPAFKGRS